MNVRIKVFLSSVVLDNLLDAQISLVWSRKSVFGNHDRDYRASHILIRFRPSVVDVMEERVEAGRDSVWVTVVASEPDRRAVLSLGDRVVVAEKLFEPNGIVGNGVGGDPSGRVMVQAKAAVRR